MDWEEERKVDCPWCNNIIEPLYYVSSDKIICTCPVCKGIWEEEKK